LGLCLRPKYFWSRYHCLLENRMFVSKKIIIAAFGILALVVFRLISISSPHHNQTTIFSQLPAQLGTEAPTYDSVPTSANNQTKTKVLNVIDGDTFKIEGEKIVRLIGIDAPETSKGGECYAQEATNKLEEMILNKEVLLEKDVSETDKYHRLLRYVWVGDVLVNEALVLDGFAKASSYPPDIKYQERFKEAERAGREKGLGLWGDTCTKPTIKPSSTTSPSTGGSYVCDCRKTCSQMSSCAEAQYQLNICGCKARDADGDGIACDTDCQ